MMFCHCSVGDTLCAQQQEIIYPKCLYSTSSTAVTCTEAVRKCEEDLRCRYLRNSLATNCPVSHDACAKTSLDECRRTILNARASILEQPCYCPLSDLECMASQRMMIPNNPCIEKAMVDYSRLMGYNTVTAIKTASIETNRVLENTAQSVVKEKSQPGKTRIVVDSRGLIKSGSDRFSGNRRTDYGRGGQVRIPSNMDALRGFRVEKWKSSATEKEARAPERTDDNSIGTTSVAPTLMTTSMLMTPSILTTTSMVMTTYKRIHKGSNEGRRLEKPRTTLSPISTEPPPPWVTTTELLPTTTVAFVTHAPPPKEGCIAKDANGREIFAHIGSVIRRYVDWSARCSSWCECIAEDELVCERLPCLEDGQCDAPLTTVDFGERLFLRDRGACFCESGTFICDFPEEMPEVYPGLYLSAGYSATDVDMLRSEVPHDVLERAGFLSSNAATDIASRLQVAFERLLPKGLLCRIVLMPELSEPGSAFMRVEWFGMNMALNRTKVQWHTGGAEKVCSPYAIKLSDYFSLGESPRFQLALSTVKQLKVLDHLDGLPSSTSDAKCALVVLLFLFKTLV
ncbi:hypothetical protein KIN20_036606 [Parelaphostrongylus tenuis]|uniref:GDNF/GAS1 domain-containing protein n=1 Tax=Parelaphostrongylus tenuis TaxID=148309 RepID=A0AAD5WLS7_PARTN|nr:hypothetical protein KIN20_036606 [Parelaphostrongylus tenuis]